MMTIPEMMSQRCGKFYFSPNTMEFWDSVVHDPPDKYNMFIESVKNCDGTKRIYCVKCYDTEDGEIATLNDFENEKFGTYWEARRFRAAIRSALNTKCGFREIEVLKTYRCITDACGVPKGIFKVLSSKGDFFLINTNDFERFVCG